MIAVQVGEPDPANAPGRRTHLLRHRAVGLDRIPAQGALDQAPERRAGRRSWLHLDLYTANQQSQGDRLVALGATPYPWRYPTGADYVVLEDPDGNLFCVVQAGE